MPPLDRTQALNKPFKQRKSFGKDTRGGMDGWLDGWSEEARGVYDPKSLSWIRLTVYVVCVRACSHEEAGGGGDPDQVSQQDPCTLRFYCIILSATTTLFSHHFPFHPNPHSGNHRALRAREVPATAGQDQVPGPARADHEPVHHHHKVKNPGLSHRFPPCQLTGDDGELK